MTDFYSTLGVSESATPEEINNENDYGSESEHSELKNDVDANSEESSPSPPALQPAPFSEHSVTDALTIDIPTITTEMVTRSTRSGTRIISPDIRRTSPRQQSPAEEKEKQQEKEKTKETKTMEKRRGGSAKKKRT